MDPCSIIQQPNKFVLSLDALDLNLLQSAYLSDHNTSTLWTVNKSKGHQNDYLQFEIKSKTEPVSVEVDGTVKDVFTETTTCYICNTEVPAAYILDHEDSLKHKAFAKIADVVLERARKHMLKKVYTSDIQKIESTYFCDHCVVVVRNTDRNKHKKSDAHKKSVSFDRLLYDLTTLYTDDHNDIDDTEELTDTNTNFVNDNNKYDRNMVLISDIKASLDEHETKVKMECIEDKINYIRLLDEYDVEKLNTLTPEGDNIRIETKDGYEVIVSEDNFHGFKRIGQKLTQCQVCKVIAKDKEEHKNSETHIRKIVKAFADKNCVRALDSSWSHCVICNEVIDNSDVHALCNEYHNKLLQKALVAAEDKFVKPKKDKSKLTYYCESCGTTMHVNNVQDHLNGYRHTMNLKAIEERNKKEEFPNVLKPEKSDVNPPKPPPPKKKEEFPDLLKPEKSDAKPPKPPPPNPDETNMNDVTDLISIKQVEKNGFEHHCSTCNILIHANNIHSHLNGTKHAWNSKSPLHYMMKPVEGSDELMCRVCSVYVVDSLKQIQSHVNTIEHREKVKAFLADNHIMERNNTFYCEPCNVSIMKTNEFYHIERVAHEINLSAHTEETAKEINDKVNGTDNTAKAVLTYEVNTTDKATKDNNNDKVNGTKETQHLCHICEVAVPNNPNNIKEHNDGERHKKNMEIVKNALAELSRPSSSTSYICVSNLHYHMEVTNNVKQLSCKICQTAIPNTKEGVHEHVNGLKHKNKYETKLKQNQITVKNEKHYCDVCKQYIGNEKELVHMDDPKHTNNLKKQTSEAKVKTVDTVQIQTHNEATEKAESMEKTTKNPIDLYSILNHHFKKIDKALLKCLVCNIYIENSPTRALNHASESKHKDAYKEILSTNLLFESDTALFFCGVCDCLIPGKGELLHVFGSSHIKKRTELTKEKSCELCNVNAPMKEHMYTMQHISNVKEQQKFLHYCTKCGLLITRTVIGQHLKYCAKIRINKLVVKDKFCFCIICDLYFTRELVEEHVASSHHQLMFNMSKAWAQLL